MLYYNTLNEHPMITQSYPQAPKPLIPKDFPELSTRLSTGLSLGCQVSCPQDVHRMSTGCPQVVHRMSMGVIPQPDPYDVVLDFPTVFT